MPLAMAGWEASPLAGRSSTTSCGVTLCAGSGTAVSAPPPYIRMRHLPVSLLYASESLHVSSMSWLITPDICTS